MEKKLSSYNNLFAEFMGWEKASSGNYMVPNTYPIMDIDTGQTECTADQMSFHDRLDWLHPVIVKTADIGINGKIRGAAARAINVYNAPIGQPIEFHYIRALEFIEWYNKKQPDLL